MTKKEYMKPAMRTVELKLRTQLLTGSTYGMNDTLSEDEVDEGW